MYHRLVSSSWSLRVVVDQGRIQRHLGRVYLPGEETPELFGVRLVAAAALAFDVLRATAAAGHMVGDFVLGAALIEERGGC